MPRFVSDRDFRFFQHINSEIVVDVIDVEVILYKIIPTTTDINIYGEATTKSRYKGISLNALVKYGKQVAVSDGFGYDANQQDIQFRFVRKLLQDVDVYPEVGDIVKYNENYYEINNINEAQLIAGRPEYNQAVICEAHLTRRSDINLEETHI
jgi:hypothetical protein